MTRQTMLITNDSLEPLSPQQSKVASLIAQGWTDKQIGAELHIASATVRWHVTRIAQRLHLDLARDVRVQIATRLRTTGPPPNTL
jgi:DNA-binding NarL/FixJ family response regulator